MELRFWVKHNEWPEAEKRNAFMQTIIIRGHRFSSTSVFVMVVTSCLYLSCRKYISLETTIV